MVHISTIQHAVALACVFLATFGTCVVAYLVRRTFPSFKQWWNAEGPPLFILLLVLFFAIAVRLGYLR
jgi:hypothetical protein